VLKRASETESKGLVVLIHSLECKRLSAFLSLVVAAYKQNTKGCISSGTKLSGSYVVVEHWHASERLVFIAPFIIIMAAGEGIR
jgi:hypothetical protein